MQENIRKIEHTRKVEHIQKIENVTEIGQILKLSLSNFFISKKSFRNRKYDLAKSSAEKAKEPLAQKEESVIYSTDPHAKILVAIHDQLVKLCVMLNNTPDQIEMSHDEIGEVYGFIDMLFKKIE